MSGRRKGGEGGKDRAEGGGESEPAGAAWRCAEEHAVPPVRSLLPHDEGSRPRSLHEVEARGGDSLDQLSDLLQPRRKYATGSWLHWPLPTVSSPHLTVSGSNDPPTQCKQPQGAMCSSCCPRS